MHAQFEFKLDVRDANGESLRETLQIVERRNGKERPELINPYEAPLILEGLWSTFKRLDVARERDSVSGGLKPISMTDMGWFCFLRKTRFEQWEMDALQWLDAVRRNPTIDLTDNS